MRKNKIIPIMISASALSIFATGCSSFGNKELIFEESRVVDITKAKDDDSYDKYRYHYTENTDTLKKYDQIELISYKGVLDENTLNYNIDLKFKNISNKSLNNINYKFRVIGPESGVEIEKITLDTIASGEDFTCNISISKEKLLQLANNDSSVSNTIAKGIIANLIDNQEFSLSYTYDYEHKEKFTIGHELNFDGSFYNKYMETRKAAKENLKSSYLNSDSYLNLVKPEEKYSNQLIETESIKLDIDKNFNFTIKAKFKNISNTTIDAFRFEPYLIIGDTSAPDTLNRKLEVRDSIKAGDTFEVSVTYEKDVIKDCLEYINKNTINARFYNDEDKLLRHIVEDRLISLHYIYNYENTEMAASIDNTISRSGKLDIMKVYEYKIVN